MVVEEAIVSGDAIACPLLLVDPLRCDRPEHGRPESVCFGLPSRCAAPAWREREIRRRERERAARGSVGGSVGMDRRKR